MRSVILCGQILSTEVENFRKAVNPLLPQAVNTFRRTDPLRNPEYVKAIGAACVARGLEWHPEF